MLQSRSRRWRWITACALCVVVAGIATAAWSLSDPLHAKARKQWKDRAIVRIAQRVNDPSWIDQEAARLARDARKRALEGGWVGEEMVVMRNGDWIVCQSVSSKEESEGISKDLFIGRGADGKWYYSTFHFCVNKCALSMMEPQPATLAQFVRAYWLEPFDGKSDDCLNETWTGGPYGQGRLQPATTAAGP